VVWEYCERSVRYIFGAKMGDPAADRIVNALRDHPAGMSRTEISALFGRNMSSNQIERALHYLKAHGHASPVQETTGGRPIERWRLTGP
jgi:poly(3-hydroxybutyrate) depolymerase